MIRHRAKEDKRNKGFTLVELLVVLTILAVLAAIAVPALLGYIDRARANADIVNARNCMEAAQAELAELYAFERAGEQEMTGDGVGGYNTNNQHQASAIPGSRGRNNNGDVEVTNENPTVAKEILKMADDNSPYIFIVGLGNRKDYGGEKGDLRCAYKCYVCMYMKDKNSRPIFYNGKEWTRKYPGTKNNETDEKVYETRNGKNNWLISKNVRIQYYILADGEGKYGVYNRSEYGRYIDSVWTFLRNQVKKYKDW